MRQHFLSEETIPNFIDIEIETFNRCNNDCAFCPANKNFDTRKPTLMDEELFYSIVEQLRAMDYRGRMSLYCNNEPLLDGRILKFIEHAKKRLPNVEHFLYTNGLLLTEEKILSLVKNLDWIVIDNYDDDFELIAPVKKILDADLPQNFKCKVRISLRKKNQKLFNRAGAAPNRIDEENKFSPQSPCILPFTQMIVRPDGKAARCCQDTFSDFSLGDLSNQTLAEIWRGKNYQDFRKELYFNGRKNLDICKSCDAFGLTILSTSAILAGENRRIAEEIFLRKNLGKVYIFDTTTLSRSIWERLRFCGVEVDGFVNVRKNPFELPCVTLAQAIGERAFVLFPTPTYDDDIFDLFHDAGYQYEKDYLIYPTHLQ